MDKKTIERYGVEVHRKSTDEWLTNSYYSDYLEALDQYEKVRTAIGEIFDDVRIVKVTTVTTKEVIDELR